MPAPIPVQLAILRWLCVFLEGVEGQWEDESPIVITDENVFRGRKFFSEEDFKDIGDLALSILEAPRPLIQDYAGIEAVKRKENWTLLLQGWAKDDKKNPSDPAYFLKSAVEKRLALMVEKTSEGEPAYPEYFRMDSMIVRVLLGQGLVRPPDGNITKYSMFYIPLIIELVTDISKPYLLTT